MRLLNRLLGAAAKVNSTLARQRVNGISLQFAFVIGLAILAGVQWGNALDAIRNQQVPLAVSMDEIATDRAPAQNYVRISGLAIPAVVYRHESGSETEWWSPLVDPAAGRGILVHRRGDSIHLADVGTDGVTGMLRRLHAEARIRVARAGGSVGGVPIDLRFELADGERPPLPGPATALAIGASLICLVFLIPYLRRNVIFQRARWPVALPSGGLAGAQVGVTASGLFVFDSKIAKRFIEVPAVVAMDNGGTSVTSRINYSYRFMYTPTARYDGLWTLPAVRGSVTDGSFGFLFFGLSRRYAYRFKYSDPAGKRRVAVIASEYPQAVAAAAALLTGFASAASAGL
jgi:hypothetical protein